MIRILFLLPLGGLLLGAGYAQEADCLSLGRLSLPLPDSGGVGEVNLQAKQADCRLNQAETKVEWLSVSIVPPGTNETAWVLRYFAQPNFMPRRRRGEVAIGSQKLTVEQEAGPRPGIAAGPSRLEFAGKKQAATAKEAPPEKKILHVGSDDEELNFSAAPGDKEKGWLQVEKQADGRSFAVSVNTKGLEAGEYSGRILIEAAGARNSPLAIPVSLKIVE